jgi:S1-C subfamily serine protease
MSGVRDFVRDEIAQALKRKIMVVPVRVGRENNLPPIPRAKDLPSDIRDVVFYQKHDVVHENFARDIAALAEAISRVRRSRRRNRAFPWAWTAASIALFLSVLAYVWHTNTVKLIRAPSAQASAPAPGASEATREWARVDKSHIAELETFLRRHGSSPEADYARARIDNLKKQVAIAASPNTPAPAKRNSAPFDVMKSEASVYKIYTMRKNGIGTSTGFLVNGQRILVANYHALIDGEKYFVGYRNGGDGRLVETRVVDRRSSTDLAVLEALEDLPGQALPLGNFEPEKLANVAIVGFDPEVNQDPVHSLPELYARMRDPVNLAPTLRSGMVSRIYSATNTALSETQIINARTVQHTAPTKPGNIGGPLFDECGTVVGVNSFSQNAQGSYFSIHSSEVAHFLRELNISYSAASACKTS